MMLAETKAKKDFGFKNEFQNHMQGFSCVTPIKNQ